MRDFRVLLRQNIDFLIIIIIIHKLAPSKETYARLSEMASF